MKAVETLKVMGLPEESGELIKFLRAFRDYTQYIINQIWNEKNIPSVKTLHRRFYHELRGKGFRAHHVKQIYYYARSVVKAVKKSNGSKPVLRMLTARIDKYDYKLDLENQELIVKVLGGKEVKIKLVAPKERFLKYMNWNNYELMIKYDGSRFWICIEFRREVKQYNIRSVLAIDVNFDNVTILIKDSRRVIKVKRLSFPLRRALCHRIWIERIQKRYPKRWKYVKGIREAIRKHGRRMRNIINDSCHKIAEEITNMALKHRSLIVVENLKNLRANSKRGAKFNKKLSLWAYHKLLSYIEYECLEKGILLMKVNPKGTSSLCPKCNNKLIAFNDRILRCSRCGFIGDRDVIACFNLISKCGVSGVTLKAPDQMQTQEGMKGNKDEGMNFVIKCYKT
ncbi:MAG: IS200/IS605 family accessory protein TnpB-related protein [Thermoprotei archaeon]|nr:IS200/IS605 family accessory protein TnpB-related protein [Thermoprotei archaeon]